MHICDPNTPEAEPEDQKFKIILSYGASPRPSEATQDTLSQERKEEREGGRKGSPDRYEKRRQIREVMKLGYSHTASK